MSLLVVGLNHRTVPVGAARAPGGRARGAPEGAARRSCAASTSPRSVLLSTCNRTEVYAHATLFHPAMQDVRDFLADTSGVDPDEFSDLLYAYHDDAAVAHLFGVAAGLDSMIIGEGEILGQVREAWQVAEREVGQRPAARRARSGTRSRSGKRARTETAHRTARGVGVVGRGVAGHAAGSASLDDRRVLVLGAGDMGEGMVLALAGAGVREIVVANRTLSRAPRSSRSRVGGRAITLDDDHPTRSSCATCCSCRPEPPTCSSSASRGRTGR